MGSYQNPNDWDYADHPKKSIVRLRCIRLGTALVTSPELFSSSRLQTTELAHRYVFRQFTPPGFSYYAGTYRGTNVDFLRNYVVSVSNEKKQLSHPRVVSREMKQFGEQYAAAMERFAEAFGQARDMPTRAALTVKLAEVLAVFLVRFFVTHPYANGNGHMGRMIVLAMFGRVGIVPVQWTIDDRPPYDDAIAAFRRGVTKPLVMVILKCIGPQ